MSEPRVSVICIFYDQEAFLDDAVASVLAQDFTDFELLLVDDGSSDRSSEIARGHAARLPGTVRYLDHPGHANCGPSATRNLGLRAARGAFVTFLDGDDRFRPGKLSDQVALLSANPTAGMVCGGYNRWRAWDGGEDEIHLAGHRGDGVSLPPETTLQVYPLGWSMSPTETMIRREIAVAIGGFEESFRHLYDDQAFYAKAFLATGVLFSDKVWLDYRGHAGSCMAQLSLHDYLATRRRFLDWFEGYLAPRDVAGKEAILQRVQTERRRLRGTFLPWARNRVRHAWILAQRIAGREEKYRRHCLAD